MTDWLQLPLPQSLARTDDGAEDCPVQPSVWRRLCQSSQPERAILQVRRNASAPMVGAYCAKVLDRQVVTYLDYVVTSISFDDLFTVVLPLTRWAEVIRRADDYVGAFTGSQPPRAGGSDWSLEDARRLRWLTDFAVRAHGLRPPGPADDVLHVPVLLAGLLREGAARAAASEDRPIRAVSLNRPVTLAAHESRRTVKMDAAERLFELDYRDLVWAVIDSGIDAGHRAFASDGHELPSRVIMSFDIPKGLAAIGAGGPQAANLLDDGDWERFKLAADVTGQPSELRPRGLRDDHGTHVAGIIGGSAPALPRPAGPVLAESRWECDSPYPDRVGYRGMCPNIRLIDLKVFDDRGAEEASVIVALAFARWLHERPRAALERFGRSAIDGVNISLSIPFEVDGHACGWTPVCQESERLVGAGVVVVAAAGNAGFPDSRRESMGDSFRGMSITDPGNAEGVITVGATHRTEPHRFGPLARSGRGPTADGRHKPDLLAPGHRIVGPAVGGGWTCETGTSQAAAHVSGVAAAVLARFPELRGQPARVKHILTSTATDLARLRDYQGHGLVDVLRALQSV